MRSSRSFFILVRKIESGNVSRQEFEGGTLPDSIFCSLWNPRRCQIRFLVLNLPFKRKWEAKRSYLSQEASKSIPRGVKIDFQGTPRSFPEKRLDRFRKTPESFLGRCRDRFLTPRSIHKHLNCFRKTSKSIPGKRQGRFPGSTCIVSEKAPKSIPNT